jgi:hypothetical protein
MGHGYSQAELDDVQARWSLRFPSDLVAILRERRSVIQAPARVFDWITSEPAEIQRMLDWPLEGFWFDVEHNDLWWPAWGPKPSADSDCHAVLKAVFDSAPRLIPLYGHRYLPEEPAEAGNPIFSVYQSDIITYGANLLDYIEREEGRTQSPWPPLKEIRFWSEAVRRNG